MDSVPNEIWLLVASYLSKRDIKSLIGVNRQLTDIALQARYRVSVAAPSSMRKHLRHSDSFIHVHPDLPHILRFVQELVFKDDPPQTIFTHPLIGHHFRFPMYRLNPLKRLFSSKHKAFREYYRQLLARVGDLQNVHAITFYFEVCWSSRSREVHNPYIGHKMKILRALASARPTQITHLSIDTSLSVLVPHWPKRLALPNLTTLRIKVKTRHIDDTSPIFTFFHPLVNKYSATLTELELTHSPWVQMANVLVGTGPLPNLQTFSFCWYIDDTPEERDVMSNFMSIHSCQLVDFRVRLSFDSMTSSIGDEIPPISPSTLNSCFDFPFPLLRHFSLYCDPRINDPSLTAVVRKFLLKQQANLLSLTIQPAFSLPPQRRLLVIPFFHVARERTPSFFALSELSITSESLHVDLLTLLVSSFPHLHYLCINGLTNLAVMDTSEILKLQLASWGLSDLILVTKFGDWRYEEKYPVTSLFPQVKRFCGLKPQAWLVDKNPFQSNLPLRSRVAADYYAEYTDARRRR